MIVTKVQQAKRDKERVNISVDGEYRFAIDKATLVRADLYKGKEISEGEITEIVRKDTSNFLSRRLMAWCYKKPRSKQEITRKIKELLDKRAEKQENADNPVEVDQEEVLETVLARLNKNGCNDEEFTRWFVQERSRQKKYGSRKVVSDLLQKGVALELANRMISEYFEDEQPVIVKTLQKKYGVDSISEIKDFSLKSKAIAYLRSKGFSNF